MSKDFQSLYSKINRSSSFLDATDIDFSVLEDKEQEVIQIENDGNQEKDEDTEDFSNLFFSLNDSTKEHKIPTNHVTDKGIVQQLVKDIELKLENQIDLSSDIISQALGSSQIGTSTLSENNSDKHHTESSDVKFTIFHSFPDSTLKSNYQQHLHQSLEIDRNKTNIPISHLIDNHATCNVENPTEMAYKNKYHDHDRENTRNLGINEDIDNAVAEIVEVSSDNTVSELTSADGSSFNSEIYHKNEKGVCINNNKNLSNRSTKMADHQSNVPVLKVRHQKRSGLDINETFSTKENFQDDSRTDDFSDQIENSSSIHDNAISKILSQDNSEFSSITNDYRVEIDKSDGMQNFDGREEPTNRSSLAIIIETSKNHPTEELHSQFSSELEDSMILHTSKKRKISINIPKRRRISINIPIKKRVKDKRTIKIESMQKYSHLPPDNHTLIEYSQLIDFLKPRIVRFSNIFRKANLPEEISTSPDSYNSDPSKKSLSPKQLPDLADLQIDEDVDSTDHVKSRRIKLNITKLAEASYSDVYLVNGLVYKILPLNQEFNSEDFLKECMAHILLSYTDKNTKQSIKVSQILQKSGIHGISPEATPNEHAKATKFDNENQNIEGQQAMMASVLPIIDFFFLTGDHNTKLLKAWDHFAKSKKSNNLRPSNVENSAVNVRNSKKNFEKFKSCKYACMILPFHGKDLESFEIRDDDEHLRIFSSIVNSLQSLEKSTEFEHRDLHWGNILITREFPSQNTSSISAENDTIDSSDLENSAKLSQKPFHEGFEFNSSESDISQISDIQQHKALNPHGIKQKSALSVRLIDFGLSRFTFHHNSDLIIFSKNLSNSPSLFTGKGSIQYEIYRKMVRLKFSEAENALKKHIKPSQTTTNNFIAENETTSNDFCRNNLTPSEDEENDQIDSLMHEKVKGKSIENSQSLSELEQDETQLNFDNLLCTTDKCSCPVQCLESPVFLEGLKVANWTTFSSTNIIWLRYLLEKLRCKGLSESLHSRILECFEDNNNLQEFYQNLQNQFTI